MLDSFLEVSGKQPIIPLTMIDIHGHFLPGIDDGARDLEQCLTLLAQAEAEGVTHVVMTPHYWPRVFDNHPGITRPVFDDVQIAAKASGLSLTMSLAGEVRLCDDNIVAIETRDVPFIGRWGDRDAVLIEMPDGSIPPGTLEYVIRMLRRGIQPIIAHPERIKSVMRDVMEIEPFVRAGCLLQLTCASVTGRFGDGAHLAAWQILRQGWAHFLASDAHHPERRPCANAAAAELVARDLGLDVALELTLVNPSKLLGFDAQQQPEPATPGLRVAA